MDIDPCLIFCLLRYGYELLKSDCNGPRSMLDILRTRVSMSLDVALALLISKIDTFFFLSLDCIFRGKTAGAYLHSEGTVLAPNAGGTSSEAHLSKGSQPGDLIPRPPACYSRLSTT
jgi:hypothetical protein